MISSSVIILLSSSATSPRSSCDPLEALWKNKKNAQIGLLSRQKLQFTKERWESPHALRLTVHRVLRIEVSPPLHFIWGHSEKHLSHFAFISHDHVRSEQKQRTHYNGASQLKKPKPWVQETCGDKLQHQLKVMRRLEELILQFGTINCTLDYFDTAAFLINKLCQWKVFSGLILKIFKSTYSCLSRNNHITAFSHEYCSAHHECHLCGDVVQLNHVKQLIYRNCTSAKAVNITSETLLLLLKRPGTSLYTMSCKVLSDLQGNRQKLLSSHWDTPTCSHTTEKKNKLKKYQIHGMCNNPSWTRRFKNNRFSMYKTYSF